MLSNISTCIVLSLAYAGKMKEPLAITKGFCFSGVAIMRAGPFFFQRFPLGHLSHTLDWLICLGEQFRMVLASQLDIF